MAHLISTTFFTPTPIPPLTYSTSTFRPKTPLSLVLFSATPDASPSIRKPGGLQKPVVVSPALQNFLGVSETSRADTIKKVWAYIKDHHLQSESDKREILCDEKLKAVLGKDRVHFLEVSGLLGRHFPKKN